MDDLELEPLSDSTLPQKMVARREEAELAWVLEAMAASEGNVTKAAVSLGMSRSSFYRLRRKLGLT